ncbi:MAG: helix-turn-helix transcriptional regulator, partial [Lachnospiraceae bacterium]|nr:helix-turn-helix transcriptional regulator [Lachnospiraceae bacterium]
IELNVTQETISAYEHGRHMPSLEALMKMSDFFNASMDYIMGLSDVRTCPVRRQSHATAIAITCCLIFCILEKSLR